MGYHISIGTISRQTQPVLCPPSFVSPVLVSAPNRSRAQQAVLNTHRQLRDIFVVVPVPCGITLDSRHTAHCFRRDLAAFPNIDAMLDALPVLEPPIALEPAAEPGGSASFY